MSRNYDAEVLVLTGQETFRGHDGVRESARLLSEVVEPGSYRFRALVIGDRMGYAEWSAQGDQAVIRDGADSYLVEEGKIRAQAIHSTLVSSKASTAALPEGADGRTQGARRAEDKR